MSYWERPCAAAPWHSYRYNGRYGWIMIGALDDNGALSEAARSTTGVDRANLQRWDGSAYVNVTA